ncbi:hypothetical protein AB0D04_12915 [Streptomyces sp. NPDC048483]|uniref:hypothetical protein n=1 Tax=Streptomyces sp. NPDC048483 TaxID=3154927 RepID=UPI0034415004
MAVCEVCGNDYAMAFDIHAAGVVHTFDSIECAAQKIAPHCDNCDCRILGHGLQSDGKFFCCAHCARLQGHAELADSS